MRAVIFSLMWIVLLSACSARPAPDLLRPQIVAEPAGARIVRVHSVTTRATYPDAPWAYGANRSGTVQYGAFDISIPPAHETGQIEWPGSFDKADPATHFITRQQQRMGRASFLSQVGRGQIGLYVHGYNTSYQEALYRLAQLATDAQLDGTPVLFSWPSEGQVAAYLADRDGADFSRDALVALLSDLTAGRSRNDPVIVLSHSMGGRLTMEALRQLKLTGRGDVLDRVEVILAAPDIDIDLFRNQIATVGKLRHPITVLTASDDRALRLSARLAARRTRLGQLDVRDPDVQKLAVDTGIRIVDITALPAGEDTHNRYVDLISSQQNISTHNPFSGLRRAGVFVFNQAGNALRGIGTVLAN
ncbi:esterase/lipase superfamily enzyme [Rhodobacteraceae bacterium MBR-64]